jgi:adenylyltransferase and sulfurtransferase
MLVWLTADSINPFIQVNMYPTHLVLDLAEQTLKDYDLILDCTDHPSIRYLISDACVLLGKPLVSASALRTDGQLMVLNSPPGEGPCYRCVFPKPPPPDAVLSCGEGGILGPVVGVMGVLQALEAVKLLARGERGEDEIQPSMLLLSASGDSLPRFRTVRMRGRRRECIACGTGPNRLTLGGLRQGAVDYVEFCGTAAPIDQLKAEQRISPVAFRDGSWAKMLLLDVREKEHFEMGSIPGAVNVPYSGLQHYKVHEDDAMEVHKARTLPEWLPQSLEDDTPIFVVCRVGNDSQVVAKRLLDLGLGRNGARFVGDIEGGIRAWKIQVDGTIPFA